MSTGKNIKNDAVTAHSAMLFAADVSVLSSKELFSEAYRIMPEERRKKIDRYIFEKDKNLSLGAGLLAVYALKLFGIDTEKTNISVSQKGKPYIPGENVFFNISHSEKYAVCAIATHEIGCDIEMISHNNDGVAKRFFSQDEYAFICGISDEKLRKESFYRLWTLKESFVKAVGLGLSLPFDSFSVLDKNGGISLRHCFSGRYYEFFEPSVFPDAKCAVCMEMQEDPSENLPPVIKICDLEEIV